MKKKIFGRISAALIVVAILIIPIAFSRDIALAAENIQLYQPKSYGRFVYDDGDLSNNKGREHDILIEASDFIGLSENISTLADITDGLAASTVRKSDIIDTIEGIKNNTEADKAAGAEAVKELIQAFWDGVNKICDKLSGLGFTPATNSPDDINNAIQDIYDSRYARGYSDGIGQIQSANAQITYTYHHHEGNSNACGGCYTVLKEGITTRGCGGGGDCNEGPYGPDTSGLVYYHGKCSQCGTTLVHYGGKAWERCPNGTDEPYSYYDLGCGMSENTIISAVVKFAY